MKASDIKFSDAKECRKGLPFCWNFRFLLLTKLRERKSQGRGCRGNHLRGTVWQAPVPIKSPLEPWNFCYAWSGFNNSLRRIIGDWLRKWVWDIKRKKKSFWGRVLEETSPFSIICLWAEAPCSDCAAAVCCCVSSSVGICHIQGIG